MTERLTRTPAFRIAFWGGLSAGPVLALLWPVFVRLVSGVWPASPLALSLAMLTLGTLTGMAAAFTVFLPLLFFLRLQPGRALRWQAAALGGMVCFTLTAVFGLLSGAERVGMQWPVWVALGMVGAVCGWLGALTVRHPSADVAC